MDDVSLSAILPRAVVVIATVLHCALCSQLPHMGVSSAYKALVGRPPCSSHLDCDRNGTTGEICYWLYEGCNLGVCVCDPKTHVSQAGRCVPVRRRGESCDVSRLNDTCADSLQCVDGKCECPYSSHAHRSDDGWTSYFSWDASDPRPCLQENVKLLGMACDPTTDKCYHDSAYASTPLVCSFQSRVCTCDEGYKQDGRVCRRLHVWETGCTRDYHCEGGAVCVDQRCQCPSNYRAVAGHTKCARIGAVLELPLGQECDEIFEQGYCARGLVCHKCAENLRSVCVKYLSQLEPDSSAYTSGYCRDRFAIFYQSVSTLLMVLLGLLAR